MKIYSSLIDFGDNTNKDFIASQFNLSEIGGTGKLYINHYAIDGTAKEIVEKVSASIISILALSLSRENGRKYEDILEELNNEIRNQT